MMFRLAEASKGLPELMHALIVSATIITITQTVRIRQHFTMRQQNIIMFSSSKNRRVAHEIAREGNGDVCRAVVWDEFFNRDNFPMAFSKAVEKTDFTVPGSAMCGGEDEPGRREALSHLKMSRSIFCSRQWKLLNGIRR